MQIIQDTFDFKKYVSDEINFEKLGLNERNLKIATLEKKLLSNQYNAKSILSEVKIILLEIENLSISNHTFSTSTDSLKTVPVLFTKVKQISLMPQRKN
ncbi:hypothetical protein EKM01_13275 [Flavobacterium sp. RSP46]|uniref:hypothetical protein n=1 Tax=Flavobacterium sp. RSP46 TaxID=2497486 RepID=UPI000F879A6D|nr:hypothetical protein [Flavobacterium sp. RSP46]RTY89756.1 hypothetical protein EKM01_13275 [Flavobacterium sp. RSP46]